MNTAHTCVPSVVSAMYERSRDSSVSAVTMLPAGHRGIGVRFRAGARLPFYQCVAGGGGLLPAS
jgi:hypothetical protein